jgi:hypothetical protein
MAPLKRMVGFSLAIFYCCTVTMYAPDLVSETFEDKAKAKKGKVFFLNKVADTIRLFISEIGSKPHKACAIEYDGDLKEDFMKELHKESKKNTAVPSGRRILYR